MKRYRVITYKLDNVKRNIRTKEEAQELAEALCAEFNNAKSFFFRVDKFYTLWAYIMLVARILYIPIYFTGFILLMAARLVLSLAYLLILQFKASVNVLKFMFVWRQ
jgi:hypothetical protein